MEITVHEDVLTFDQIVTAHFVGYISLFQVLKFEAQNVSHVHSCGMGVRVGLHLLCLDLCHSS